MICENKNPENTQRDESVAMVQDNDRQRVFQYLEQQESLAAKRNGITLTQYRTKMADAMARHAG